VGRATLGALPKVCEAQPTASATINAAKVGFAALYSPYLAFMCFAL
jgi:hypothetical protein